MTWIVGDGQQLELEVRGRVERTRRRTEAQSAVGSRQSALGARSQGQSPTAGYYAGAPEPVVTRRALSATAPCRPRPLGARLRSPLVARNARDYAFYVYTPECKYLWMSVVSCLDWL